MVPQGLHGVIVGAQRDHKLVHLFVHHDDVPLLRVEFPRQDPGGQRATGVRWRMGERGKRIAKRLPPVIGEAEESSGAHAAKPIPYS